MMSEFITIAGFILAVFGSGVAVGRFVEKVEQLYRKNNEEYKDQRR